MNGNYSVFICNLNCYDTLTLLYDLIWNHVTRVGEISVVLRVFLICLRLEKM